MAIKKGGNQQQMMIYWGMLMPPSDTGVYDPTCGSGSLLLKFDDQAENTLSLFVQENDNATTALAKMNMILHNNEDAEIVQNNTLADPQYLAAENSLKAFDFIVVNPPFSLFII